MKNKYRNILLFVLIILCVLYILNHFFEFIGPKRVEGFADSNKNELFIDNLYKLLNNTLVDPNGKDFWVKQLDQNKKSYKNVVMAIMNIGKFSKRPIRNYKYDDLNNADPNFITKINKTLFCDNSSNYLEWPETLKTLNLTEFLKWALTQKGDAIEQSYTNSNTDCSIDVLTPDLPELTTGVSPPPTGVPASTLTHAPATEAPQTGAENGLIPGSNGSSNNLSSLLNDDALPTSTLLHENDAKNIKITLGENVKSVLLNLINAQKGLKPKSCNAIN